MMKNIICYAVIKDDEEGASSEEQHGICRSAIANLEFDSESYIRIEIEDYPNGNWAIGSRTNLLRAIEELKEGDYVFVDKKERINPNPICLVFATLAIHSQGATLFEIDPNDKSILNVMDGFASSMMLKHWAHYESITRSLSSKEESISSMSKTITSEEDASNSKELELSEMVLKMLEDTTATDRQLSRISSVCHTQISRFRKGERDIHLSTADQIVKAIRFISNRR